MPKSSGAKKKDAAVMDVAHPGKSAPSANSKSVIVPSRPMIKDPMMVAGEEADAADEKPAPEPHRTAPELSPETPDNADKPDAPAEEASDDETHDHAETAAEKDEAAPAEKESEQAKALDAAAAQDAKHDAEIEKLVDGKQYYLPINTVEKRRSRRFVGLGILLSLLLIVAWADIALDAGLIQISGIKPVTHFFSN